MAGAKIGLSDTNGELKKDTYNKAEVNLPLDKAESGYVINVFEQDAGNNTLVRSLKTPDIDSDYRQRMAMADLMLNEKFPGATLNSSLWTAPVTTMTVVVANDFCTLNSGLSTANAAVARLQSYRLFPIFGVTDTYLSVNAQLAQLPVTNNITEIGFGIATGTSAPTDGVFLRLLANGEAKLISNNNGTETQGDAISNWTTYFPNNETKDVILGVNHKKLTLWIDDDIVSTLDLPNAGSNFTMSSHLPFFARTYNTGVTSSAQALRLALVNITVEGASWVKDDLIAAAGGHSSFGQTGQTIGTTANFANSANPTAAVPTNTTAALGSGLGGQFWETDTLAVTTDGIISSYQVPAGTASAPGKTFLCKYVKIDSSIQTALTGGGYVAVWSLAFGHNAVSLATTVSSTSKAPVRIPLGQQVVASGAAISTGLTSINVTFDDPIPIFPGEFIQVVKKKVGTAPSAGVVAHTITLLGRWI